MKKALMPLLLIVAGIMVLGAAVYWYYDKYGAEGPFPSHHHH